MRPVTLSLCNFITALSIMLALLLTIMSFERHSLGADSAIAGWPKLLPDVLAIVFLIAAWTASSAARNIKRAARLATD